jgi:23S rRNA (cytosine1962-C5)-methyltransferase
LEGADVSALLFTPKRYQLKKEAVQVVNSGHPWLFRTHLSTAAEVFQDGQWLALYDSANRVVGFGVYAKEGLIGVRLLKRGDVAPNLRWVNKMLEKAWSKRVGWAKDNRYEACRLLHGESDGIPGVVLDQYGGYGVLQTYSSSMDVVGRYCAQWFRKQMGLHGVLWKFPVKRKSQHMKDRVLFGSPPAVVSFMEGKLKLTVDIGEGQKSGAFLDLRGLRQWLSNEDLTGKRVLNLFSYTGTLGLAAEVGGAKEIWNVDISGGALEAGKKYHTKDASKYRWVKADVFDWLSSLQPTEKFDLIIVDPPMMASRREQVPVALKAYQRVYRSALAHLNPGGTIVGACCTSRIPRKVFDESVAKSLGTTMRRKNMIVPERDHPVGFAEADYLKINIYG